MNIFYQYHLERKEVQVLQIFHYSFELLVLHLLLVFQNLIQSLVSDKWNEKKEKKIIKK